MAETISLSDTNLIYILLAFLVMVIIITCSLIFYGKCANYIHQKGKRLFSFWSMLLYLIPGCLLLLNMCFSKPFMSFRLFLYTSIAAYIIALIICIFQHGIIYGIGISFFRTMAGILLTAIAWGLSVGFIIAAFAFLFTTDAWFEKATILITLDTGEVVSVNKTSKNTWVDTAGNLYYRDSHGIYYKY